MNKNSSMSKRYTIISGLLLFQFIVLATVFFIALGSENPKTLIAILVIAQMILLIIIFFMQFKVGKNINAILKTLKCLASGDLTVANIPLDKVKGMEELAVSINDVKMNFKTFIELTKGNVITLAEAVDNLSKSAKYSREGNENIAESMTSISLKTQEQLDTVKETLQAIENTNSQVDNIAKKIIVVEESLKNANESTKQGSVKVEEYNEKIITIATQLDEANSMVREFHKDILEIGDIGEFIIEISEQLGLLGLNASIEAARVGDEGKGFAVVANEMNLLSAKTTEGMNNINQILSKVLEKSNEIDRRIDQCAVMFEESKASFTEVDEAFGKIEQENLGINQQIQGISNEIVEINANSKETEEKAEGLFGASNIISDNSQEAAAVTEEALAEIMHIESNTLQLGEMMDGISRLLQRFNTSILPVEKTSSKKMYIKVASPLDNPFWHKVRRGVEYAGRELKDHNVNVELVNFEATDENPLDVQILKYLQKSMQEGQLDGIVFPGFFGNALAPALEEAKKKNIPAYTFNCDSDRVELRQAQFSPDTLESGALGAKALAKAINYEGNVYMIFGNLNAQVHKLRREGFLKEIKKYSKIVIIGEDSSKDELQQTYEITKKCLANHKDIKGIFVTDGGLMNVVKGIEESNRVGKTVAVGYDHTKDILEAIKKGIIAAAIGQDPFAQGHDPVVWMFNCIMENKPIPSEDMWISCDVVDQDNVEDLIDD